MSHHILHRPDGERIAFRKVDGAGPTVLWVGGFRSDMEGTKALALEQAARERGWAYVRYDHFAHGASSGDWKAATVGRWREDAIALIDSIEGPVLPVGSSMGGWVALLAALARPEKLAGLVLIAPAPDFTERLMWPSLPDHINRSVKSGAGAISTSPARFFGRASAASSATQPPMDDPTGSTGPSMESIMAMASSRQRPTVAAFQSPDDAPWAKWS